MEFEPHAKRQKTNNAHEPKNKSKQKEYHCETCGDGLDIETLLSSNVHCKLCSRYWCAGSCGEQKITCPYCGYKVIQPE
jgi:DNA-directed RNA polymerase subunit RPC12/RpoP